MTTRGDLKAWRARQRRVAAFEREELRATPVAQKFRQLAALMHSARALGWATTDEREVAVVRERWRRLSDAWPR